MTLHEAIKKFLLQSGGQMTTRAIADALNKNKWYKKKNGSLIVPYQILGRAKNYPLLFDRNGSTISLVGSITKKRSVVKFEKPKPEIKAKVLTDKTFVNSSSIDQSLMNENQFKIAGIIDSMVPVRSCGLYCIRIPSVNKLPKPFNTILSERGHNIVYIGIATGCLNKRFLNQELRGNGHGTFFRSLGAILGYKPPKGSLLIKANKRNYKFSAADNKKIINWINKNLTVNWIEYDADFDTIETKLIRN